MGRPNLILIVADDHRATALGRTGSEPVQTPHLDQLAEEGCNFSQLRIEGGDCAAVCIPTRASLMTGSPVNRVAIDREGRTLRPGVPFLPEILRRHGYHCHHIGKWHQDIASLRRGFHGGSSVFTGGYGDPRELKVHDWGMLEQDPLPEPRSLNGYASEVFAREAVEFLENRPDSPFFLQVALTLPHDPFHPPPDWNEPTELPPLPDSFLPNHPFEIGDPAVRDEKLLPKPLEPISVRRMTASYYGLIAAIDALLGQVMDGLRRLRLESDTFVIYTSDHGLSGGRHGLLGKQNLYESTVRIPGILRGPGIPAGRQINDLASQIDLAPTLLDLLNIQPRQTGMEGVSLKSMILEGRPRRVLRRYQFARFRSFLRMITDGDWKLIVTRVGAEPVVQLFRISQDPEERRNLVDDPESQPVFFRLLDRLNHWLLECNDEYFSLVDPGGIPKGAVGTSHAPFSANGDKVEEDSND